MRSFLGKNATAYFIVLKSQYTKFIIRIDRDELEIVGGKRLVIAPFKNSSLQIFKGENWELTFERRSRIEALYESSLIGLDCARWNNDNFSYTIESE